MDRAVSVVVAEDNEVNQRVFRAMLRQLGHEPVLVGNGRLLVEHITGPGPYVILMDVQMPEMDGIEATRAVRAQHPNKDIWIMAVTANASSSDRERCLDAGMNDFLAKPVTLDELEMALANAFSGLALPFEATTTAALVSTFDPSVLLGLQAVIGLDEINNLLSTFADSAQQAAQSLRHSVDERNCADIQHWAHRLKGSSAVIGAVRLTEASTVVVDQAQDQRIDDEAIATLFTELDRVLRELPTRR